jgi:hypothetical protein
MSKKLSVSSDQLPVGSTLAQQIHVHWFGHLRSRLETRNG